MIDQEKEIRTDHILGHSADWNGTEYLLDKLKIIGERITAEYGSPCSHEGCFSHISHPCEECGRIGGIRLPEIWERYIIDLREQVRDREGTIFNLSSRLGQALEKCASMQRVMMTIPELLAAQRGISAVTKNDRQHARDRLSKAHHATGLALGAHNQQITINRRVMMTPNMFELGDRVTDKVSGFVGIVLAVIVYLYDNTQYQVCHEDYHEGAKVAEQWFQEDRLELTADAAAVEAEKDAVDLPEPGEPAADPVGDTDAEPAADAEPSTGAEGVGGEDLE